MSPATRARVPSSRKPVWGLAKLDFKKSGTKGRVVVRRWRRVKAPGPLSSFLGRTDPHPPNFKIPAKARELLFDLVPSCKPSASRLCPEPGQISLSNHPGCLQEVPRSSGVQSARSFARVTDQRTKGSTLK